MFFKVKKTKPNLEATLLAYEKCYAKTYKDESGKKQIGYSVFEHSCIVASVARELLKLTPKILTSSLPQYADLPALLHDIGKICPTFQKKIQPDITELESINPLDEDSWGGHSNLSALTVRALFNHTNEALAYIVGKHHERFQNLIQKETFQGFGGTGWQEERVRCARDLLVSFYGSKALPFFAADEITMNYLLGLTMVADWLGSGSDFGEPSPAWPHKIETVVKSIGFGPKKIVPGLSFSDVFAFEPREIQKEFYSAVSGPGLYVLEAPMGLGKTEAALYAGYKMLMEGKAGGIYFALPTQLTSEKIHERMQNFLQIILAPSTENSKAINMLLHGKAWLKSYGLNAYHENGNFDYSWFATKKRALLAPFGVGTIDQALMSVINVKHAAVRRFGLAGKVIILDEVHSYDTYTGTLLDELITSLLALNCTVIILSATLTKERRLTLFPPDLAAEAQSNAYPLVSAYVKEEQSYSEKEASIVNNSIRLVAVHPIMQDTEALAKALGAAENGSQVLWIENTVAEAQERYCEFAAQARGLDIEIGLLHSRFTPQDRAEIENYWLDLFGKNNQNRYAKGRILIGTQVLEQSIDIDADLLFARFCPTDMLLQRLGRLHRHAQIKRLPHIKCEAYILSPTENELAAQGIEAFGKSQYVYAPYVLWRSYEVWKDLQEITLPTSIRPLLEKTYIKRTEEGFPAIWQNELAKKKEELHTQALRSLTKGIAPLSDEQAQTRFSENEQKEILLLKKWSQNKDEITVSPYAGGEFTITPRLSLEECKKISIELMSSTVKIPEHVFPAQKSAVFKKLSALAGGIADCALVQEDNSLAGCRGKYQLFYTPKLGLAIEK